MEREAALKRYIAFLETLKPEDLSRLGEVCAPSVRFEDPFNQAKGLEAYARVLRRMFEDLPEPRFTVSRWALGRESCFLSWRFSGKTKGGINIDFEGLSEVFLSEDGLVLRHRDFWDAGRGFYERLPLLGRLLRAVRRRVSAA